MALGHSSKQQNDLKPQFLEKLMDLTNYFGNDALLAEALGFKDRSTVSKVRSGKNTSETIKILVERLHKEIFSKNEPISDSRGSELRETAENSYQAGLKLPDELMKRVVRYASEAGVSPRDFIERCLTDYGRDTRDDILRHTPGPHSTDSGNSSAVKSELAKADKDLAEIIKKKARELDSQTAPPK